MSDNIEIAETLIEKGKTFGFTSATHHYRIALDTMDRRKASKAKTEIIEEEESSSLDDILPEIDLLPIQVDEDLIPLESEDFIEDDVLLSKKNYRIPQLQVEKESLLNTYDVLAAVSKVTRDQKLTAIETNAVVKDSSGELKIIQPNFTLSVVENDVIEEESTTIIGEDPNLEDFAADLRMNDTLDLDYIAKTDVKNEFEQELLNLEIVNTIPFQWQVIDIKSDLNLDERKKTEEGLVYTWKSGQLNPGQSKSVEYILRKRIERSIILRRGAEVLVLSSYYSIDQNLTTELNFVNTSGELFREVLIEDVVPPELIVNNMEAGLKIKPVTIPTHDSTLFRWMFRTLAPGDNFHLKYSFKEKPLTRHYIDEIEYNNEIIRIEKVSQPVIESLNYEFLWYYKFINPLESKLVFTDRIPSDVDIILVDPPHLKPSIFSEKTCLLLKWEILDTDKEANIVIRLQSKESFTPLAPSIELNEGKLHLVDRKSTSEKKIIDLRQKRPKQKEIL